MCGLTITNKDGAIIKSVEDWFRLAPPKEGHEHWKDGRSAKELAKAFFRKGRAAIPAELGTLLSSHPVTKGFAPTHGIAEMVTRLDSFGGEHRNHDLILSDGWPRGRFLICIEAKADESFGPLVGEHRADKAKVQGSKVPERIDLLSKALFGRPMDEQIAALRYQLLTAVAGTLIEAKLRGANGALFLAYEFRTSETKPDNLERNHNDLSRFSVALAEAELGPCQIIGPIKVLGGADVPKDFPLWIGSLSVDLDGISP